MKNLQERIAELENQGWTYENEFRLATGKGNILVQFMAMTKGNEYRKIENGKIYAAKKIMTEIEYAKMGE